MRGLLFVMGGLILGWGAGPLSVEAGRWFPPPGAGLTAQPLPPRQPVPFGETVPWPGFGPHPATRSPHLPLDGWVHRERWAALRLALAPPDSGAAIAPDPTPTLTSDPGPDALAREGDAFREVWGRALDAAESGRAGEVRRLLQQTPASTVAGERLSRRLLFAAVVTENNRTAADSLFYRMRWDDRGRTAARLGAWERLEDGRGKDAENELNALVGLTSGEQGAKGMARWMAGVAGADADVPVDPNSGSVAEAAGRLLRARGNVLRGDTEGAREELRALRGRTPPEWEPAERAVAAAVEEMEGGATQDPSGSAAGLRIAVEAYLAENDKQARDLLNEWLTQWPGSPDRGIAYVLRAELNLVDGNLADAEIDLRATERLGGERLEVRRQILLAFLRARQNRFAEAGSILDRQLAGPWGATHEAEGIFYQTRISRLAGDEDAVAEGIRRLEEGFPDSGWLTRAREDNGVRAWDVPWRSAPPPPELRVELPAPSSGPWGQLLWGESYLSQEGAVLRGTTTTDPTGVNPRASTEARLPPGNLVFAQAGLGAPASLLLGGGLAGGTGDLLYRFSLGRSLAQQRNELPDYRRLDWEAGLALDPDRLHLGLTAEGTARTDDDAPVIGLSVDQMEASWWGIRGEAGYSVSDVNIIRGSFSQGRGLVENGADHWRTDQTWISLDADLDSLSGGWAGQLTLAALDYRQPAISTFTFWYRDVRLVKRYRDRGYLGVRGALYNKRALLMPIAGVEGHLGGGWTAWAATEPTLLLPSFREVFAASGDWNVPDFTLPAERRYLDLKGGLGWRDRAEMRRANAEVNVYKTGELRTWRQTGGLWTEQSLEDATGIRIKGEAAGTSGQFSGGITLEGQRVRSGGKQVPYVPTYVGHVDLNYRLNDWRFGIKTLAVSGREDENEVGYGAFARWDLEAAFRYAAADLPLGFQTMEFTLRIENLTDVEDRRWPGVPAYGLGIYGGVQAVYGN